MDAVMTADDNTFPREVSCSSRQKMVRRYFAAGVLFGIVTLFVAAVAQFSWDMPIDDTFIYYHFARNLSNVGAFEYNSGQRVYGSTSPLWVIVLAATHRMVGDVRIYDAGQVLGIFFSCVATIFTYVSVRNVVGKPCWGLVAAGWLAFDPNYIRYSASGMETSMATAWLTANLLALSALIRRGNARLLLWVSVLGAVAALARPEYSLVLGLELGVCAILLMRRQRYLSIRLWCTAICLAALILGSWLFFAYIHFGHILPNPFYAKTHNASIGEMSRILLRVVIQLVFANSVAMLCLPVLALLWVRRARHLSFGADRMVVPATCFLSCAAIALGWAWNGAWVWFRYSLYLDPLLVVLVATLLGYATHDLRGQKQLCIALCTVQAFFAGILLLRVVGPHTIITSRMRNNILGQISDDIDRISPNAEQHIALTEAGIIAYRAANPQLRRTYDLAGLVADETLRMSKGEYLRRMRPDFLVEMELTPRGWMHGNSVHGIPDPRSLDILAIPLATYGIEVVDENTRLPRVPLTFRAPRRYRVPRSEIPTGSVDFSVYYTVYSLKWPMLHPPEEAFR